MTRVNIGTGYKGGSSHYVVGSRASLSKVEELMEFRIKWMDAFQIPRRSHMGWTVSSAFRNASLSASVPSCPSLSSSM